MSSNILFLAIKVLARVMFLSLPSEVDCPEKGEPRNDLVTAISVLVYSFQSY